MNPLDWVLAVLLTWSTVRAFMRGFFREAFALAGIIVGLLLAAWLYNPVATQLAGLITTPTIAQCVAFCLVLAATMVVFSLSARLLRKTASAIGLGFFDRLGGALFGLARGFLLGVALLTACTAFLPTAPWIKNSRLAPYFLRGVHAVSFLVPRDLNHKIAAGALALKHTAPDWIK